MRIDGYEVNNGHVIAVFISDKKRNIRQHKYEPARPHGEWKCNRDDLELICSVCGEVLPFSDEYDYETNFCPNCGADMREGDPDDQ